jgi:hypothetical protein
LALSLGQIANVPDRSLAAIATAQALARDATGPEPFMIGKAVDAGGWFGVYHFQLVIVTADSFQLVLIPVQRKPATGKISALFGSLRSIAFV